MLLASPNGEAVAEAELASSGPTEEVTMEVSDTAAGTKQRGAEWPTPPQPYRKKARRGPSLGIQYLSKLRGITSSVWCLFKTTHTLC